LTLWGDDLWGDAGQDLLLPELADWAVANESEAAQAAGQVAGGGSGEGPVLAGAGAQVLDDSLASSIDHIVLADAVVATRVWHAATSTAWRVKAKVNDSLAHASGESRLALAPELEVAEIVAHAVVAARKGLAHARLLLGSVDGASSQLLVPEEHLGASAHGPLALRGALQEDVARLGRELEELSLHGQVLQGARSRDGGVAGDADGGAEVTVEGVDLVDAAAAVTRAHLVALHGTLVNVHLALDAGEADGAQALVLVADLVDNACGVVEAGAERAHGLHPTVRHAVGDLLVEDGAGGAGHAHKDAHLGADDVLAAVHGVRERLDLGHAEHLLGARVGAGTWR